MGNSLIWWSAVSLEVVFLLRGAVTGLLKKYPFFYAYISCVLLKEIIGLLSYHYVPSFYEPSYWPAEFATVVASYLVIFEIFRQTVRYNPGVTRVTEKVLLVVLAVAVPYAVSDLLHKEFASWARAIAEMGRDLRYVEGALLLVILWLFVRHRISICSNLLGLITGYSFWVGLNVVNLLLWFLPGNEVSVWLRRSLPTTYTMTLAIWCAAFWAPRAEPVQPPEREIERDYELLRAKTRAALANLSTRVERTLRP